MCLGSGDHFSFNNIISCCNIQLYRFSLLFKRDKSYSDFQWWRSCRSLFFLCGIKFCKYINRTDQSGYKYTRDLYCNKYYFSHK